MKAGNLINVTIVDDLGNNKFEVIEKDSGLCGTLSVKGRLKKQKDGSIKAWVIDFYEQQNKFYCGNAYFGKYSISEGISKNYIRIISNLYKDIDEIEAEDLSILKGVKRTEQNTVAEHRLDCREGGNGTCESRAVTR